MHTFFDRYCMRMRHRHVASQLARHLTRRYPFLRRLSVTTTLLTIIWLYATHRGERSTFVSHIDACHWEKWEEWPADAAPHHLVFIADPQIVDPHTYPGRPWPLSSLTESYTDRYMARNFRLINEKLDPDSVVFLGDLFDGGREWATGKPRALRTSQRDYLVQMGVLKEGEIEGQRETINVDGDAYSASGHKLLPRDGKPNLRDFVPGENGRWSKYAGKQWDSEYERFGNIFFSSKQLYPQEHRQLLPTWDVEAHPVSIDNGAPRVTWPEYAIVGSKHRELRTSLPGNHDLGFGAGVQVAVRDRFQSHFGEPNSVYVIGNHTFVSVDTPSLSAYDEYVEGVGEVTADRRNMYYHIWKPTHNFLDDLSNQAPKAVARALNEFYPGAYPTPGLPHEVTDPATMLQNNQGKVSAKQKPQLPVVLLSHVPLFRNPHIDCGKLREKGKAIPLNRGYQYQNVLTPTLSSLLAKKVATAGNIQHIFSGDDHDYCDLTHRFNVGRWDEDAKKERVVMRTVREITVKSFSWAMGVRRPGFMLVSLWNPVDEAGETVGTPLPTIQSQLCLLPDQLGVFLGYAWLLGWTALVLLARAVVIGLRRPSIDDEEDSEEQMPRFSLPRHAPRSKANGRANGYSSPNKSQNSESKGRQRASSTSTSNMSNNNTHLGVQRSYNARTRSVSPAAVGTNIATSNYALPEFQRQNGPLIDKAGYYPQMRWQDPDDSDEESRVGSQVGEDEQDSQAKWKKRRRTPSRARRALDEFVFSVVSVALPAGLFYVYLIRHG